ncbi:MAG: hypothetical protein ACE15C_19820 [Phycisphaerae bacterium]
MKSICAMAMLAAMGCIGCSDAAARAATPPAASRPAASMPATAPAGGAIFFSESFETGDVASRGWYDTGKLVIAGTAAAGKGCAQFEWRAGGSQPVGPSGARHLFDPTDEVYLRFYIKLSKGWDWTGRPYHPHLTHFMTTENEAFAGPAASHLTMYVEPCDGRLRLGAQDIQNRNMPHGLTQGPIKGGYNGMLYDSKDKLFTDDKWHCVEARFKLNTLDLKNDKPNTDGIIQGWFDGKLVIDRQNVVLRSTDFPKMKFNQFAVLPYFGPRLLPHAQMLWIDELAVGTKRIGTLADKQPSASRPAK